MPVDWSLLNGWVNDDGSNSVGNLMDQAAFQAAVRDPIDAALGAQVQCQGRLTLTSALPVTTADVTAAGTIYFTPYYGNLVALYTGSVWVVYTFTERSLALTLTSGVNYDVFLYNNAGTLTLETLAWTNDTTRATAIVLQNGVYVKSGATTRRYLGTIRASGTNTTEESVTKRFVWNAYNRTRRELQRHDGTDSWTYTTSSFRQANGSTSNQVEVVIGLAEVLVELSVGALTANSSANVGRSVGIGVDSTTVTSADLTLGLPGLNWPASQTVPLTAALRHYPAVGYHFYPWLEVSQATGTTTWYGDVGDAQYCKAGLVGSVEG